MKKYLVILFGFGICGIVVGLYIYNRPHKDVAHNEADYSYTDKVLISTYEKITEAEELQLIDKVIEVSGKIAKIDMNGENNYVLFLGDDKNIRCEIDPKFISDVKQLSEGDEIVVRGMLSGIEGNEESEEDDIFGDIKMPLLISLSRCVVII